MSDSQSHDVDQQPIIYQEQQVLWAKIRGYPWWPAFVDKVHGAKSKQDQEHEYTVFFFGDNTHSRLGGSKLRRFLDYYTQFYPKSKTNRKLYLSIMKAQQKLKQNGGNVQIFQTLRGTMKKSKKGRGLFKSQSKISSEDHANNMLSQMPELMRNKTFPNNEQKEAKQFVSQQQQVIKQQRQQPKRRGRKPKRLIVQQQKQPQKMQIEQSQEQKSMEQKQLQSEQQSVDKKIGYRTRARRGLKQITYKVEDSKQQNKESESQQESESQNEQQNKKSYTLRTEPKAKPIVRVSMPKKRGRPKKVVQQQNINDQQQNSESQQMNKQISGNLQEQKQQKSFYQNFGRTTSQARKTRNTVNRIRQVSKDNMQQPNHENRKQSNQQNNETISSQKKQLILNRVKFCLDKKQQLVQYLDELNITTAIIQQILDLGVVNVIRPQGTQLLFSAQQIRVLQKLRSAMLHKYFPDDIKCKKRYDKMSKKSVSKGSTVDNQQSLQDLQLRRKTIIKLQKILKSVDQTINHKEKAIQIQNYFRKYDEEIGNSYKSIAYRVLRSLKDKNHTIDQVMGQLEQGDFDQMEK